MDNSRLSKLFQLAGVQPGEQFSIHGVKGVKFKFRDDFQLFNYNPWTACWEITHNFDGKLLDILRGEASVVKEKEKETTEREVYCDYDIRVHEGYEGVFCRCGVTVYVPDNKLTPPITLVQCPKCGRKMSYICTKEGV